MEQVIICSGQTRKLTEVWMLWLWKLWKAGPAPAAAVSAASVVLRTAKGARDAGSICECVRVAALPVSWRARKLEHLCAPLSIEPNPAH